MPVPRGTTPTFVLIFEEEDLDLTMAQNVYVTFRSKGSSYAVTKTGNDLAVTEKEISVYLSQDETFRFGEGSIEIQANWTTSHGDRYASEIATYCISKQLLNQVIE